MTTQVAALHISVVHLVRLFASPSLCSANSTEKQSLGMPIPCFCLMFLVFGTSNAYIYTHGFGRGNTVRAWIQFSVLKGHCPGQFAYSEDTRSSAAIMAAIVQRLVEFLKTSKANTARSEQPASLFSSQFGCLWARLHSKLFFHRQLGRLFMALAL